MVFLILILLGGVVAGVFALQGRTFLDGFAFTEFKVNTGILQQLSDRFDGGGQDPLTANITPLTSISEDDSMRFLYHSLVSTYPEASTQNITAEGFDINGAASLAYDEEIDTTLVYIRIANLPFFESSPLGMWLSGEGGQVLAASGEFFIEGEEPVAYILYSAPGDLKDQFDEAVLSYDFVGATEPLLPVITLTI